MEFLGTSMEDLIMTGLRGLVGLAVLVSVLPVVAAEDKDDLKKWADNHPKASKALGEWVKNRPKAAAKLFEWNGKHPEKSFDFVKWAITHPKKDAGDYIQANTGTPVLNDLIKDHRPATNEFMDWCRTYPDAAKGLMQHQGGLQWAGEHLYKALWQLKN
jgi:hypothetical protein